MRDRKFHEKIPYIFINCLKAIDMMEFSLHSNDYTRGSIIAKKASLRPIGEYTLEINIEKRTAESKTQVTATCRWLGNKLSYFVSSLEMEQEFFRMLTYLFYLPPATEFPRNKLM